MDNKDTEIDLIELFKTVWSEKKKIIKWAAIGALIGLVIAFSIPKQYDTVVKIAPESKTTSMMSGSMGGLAELAGIDLGGKSVDGVSAKIYPEIVTSAPFLLELAGIEVENEGERVSFFEYVTEQQKKAWWSYVISAPMKALGWVMGLFSEDNDSQDKALSLFEPTQSQLDYMGALKKMIVVTEDKKLGIFTIITTMQNPRIAAVIADSLLANLQGYMIDYKTAKTRSDLDANLARLDEARAKYYSADSLFAMAVDKNKNLVSQSAKIKLERMQNEKSLAFSIYQQLASQVELNKIALQENTPIATVIEPPSMAIRASSPNKMLMLIAFTFLGGLAASATVIGKQLLKKE